MKSRVLAILLVFVFVLGMVSTASAQEMDPCLGLSADDCAFLQASDAKSAEIQSFTLNFDFNLELDNLAAAAMMMGSTDASTPNTITVTANASNSPVVMNSAAADPSSALAMAMDVNASVTGTGTGDESGTFSFVIVDGVFYAKDPETGEWKGMTLEDAASQLSDSGMPFDPSSLLQGDASELGSMTDPSAALAQAGLAPEDVEALMSVPGFVGQQRVADADMEGQTMAVFESKVDFVPLLTSQELQEILTKMSASSSDPNAAQVGQMGMLLPMLVKEGNITLTRWIGVDDQYLHRLTLDINIAVDLAAMMGAAGGEAGQAEPITLKLTLDVGLNNINSTTAPVAPEGAVMVTPEASG
jgi:hypothetical protein